MISAHLVMKPILDKGTFHNAVEQVTCANYLRATDEMDLTDPTAEAVSILRSYGEPHDSSAAVPVGFIFVGTVNLVNQIPSIVNGTYLTNQESSSSMLGSLFVVATIAEWWDAVRRPKGNEYLEACFLDVRNELEPLTLRPRHKRLT